MLCKHNKLTNKNRTIASFPDAAIAFLPQTRGISNDYTDFNPCANKRSVNHTGSPNHCNHRQSIGLFKRVPARRCGDYLDQQR
ncbi:hypothetical protein [Nostoc sp.]|uniref:hypothetical protein n=1 Tax=Nostoc sp. TaxID=1180 RepID=UPI002FF0FA68